MSRATELLMLARSEETPRGLHPDRPDSDAAKGRTLQGAITRRDHHPQAVATALTQDAGIHVDVRLRFWPTSQADLRVFVLTAEVYDLFKGSAQQGSEAMPLRSLLETMLRFRSRPPDESRSCDSFAKGQ